MSYRACGPSATLTDGPPYLTLDTVPGIWRTANFPDALIVARTYIMRPSGRLFDHDVKVDLNLIHQCVLYCTVRYCTVLCSVTTQMQEVAPDSRPPSTCGNRSTDIRRSGGPSDSITPRSKRGDGHEEPRACRQCCDERVDRACEIFGWCECMTSNDCRVNACCQTA